jgi:hypothetical protein
MQDQFVPYDPGNLDLLYAYMIDRQNQSFGIPPTIRDIMRDLGYKSSSVVSNALRRLVELGKAAKVRGIYVAIPQVDETTAPPRIKYGSIAQGEGDLPLISFYRLVSEALELAMKPLAFDANVYYANPSAAPPVMASRYKKYAAYARAYKKANEELSKLTGGKP